MQKTIRTKVNKDADSVETKVTINWEGVTMEELQKLASATVIIDQQAIWRTSEVIPSEAEIKVRDLIDMPKGSGGFKPTPENMAARVLKLPTEERVKAYMLMGLSEKQAQAMVKLQDEKQG
jgi:hypothetical protein